MDLQHALERGIDVLLLFQNHDLLGVGDVTTLLKSNKATISRTMATLAHKGLLVEDAQTGKYRLSYRLYRLVADQLRRIDVRMVAIPEMRTLRALTQETVLLYVPSQLELVCIEQMESQQQVRRTTPIGHTMPITSGITGRVLLAWRPDYEVENVLNNVPIPTQTLAPNTDPVRYMAELAAIRKRGYASGVDSNGDGIGAISVPLRDAFARVVGALCVTGPAPRWNAERIAEHRPAIVATARRVSGRLGYAGD